MKLIGRGQVEKLSKFKSESFLTTSFYLDTDKSRVTKKEIILSFKNLLSNSKSQLDEMEISREKKESLTGDLEKINHFCSQHLASYNFPGLAIFSCNRQNFWQLFDLPSPPRNRIIFDQNPYVRPLSVILDEHHRIFALIFDRREANLYEVFMGEISPLESFVSDVPSKVREGGFEGYESKRIERHIATHLREHFKKISQMTFDLFKKNQFDWLFLGCKEEYRPLFEPLLHPYLKSRLKGWLKAMPGNSPAAVLKESQELEKKLKKKEEGEIVSSYVSELEKGGRAVSGLKKTLTGLNRGEVQTLIITLNFSQPGRICPQCRFLFVDELRCPSCQRKTEKLLDVIDEAVEAAMEKKCRVKHVTPPSKLNRYGKIGAFLRYKA
jgi:peptide subunit release factor 1 (eRF1)